MDQKVDQCLVPVSTEPEQCLVHGAAIVRRRVVHRAVPVDGIFELVPAQRHPGRTDQGQLWADPLPGDEKPVSSDPTPGHRFESGADRPVLDDAVRTHPAELQPGVPESLGMRMLATEQQVPLHPLVAVAVRFDAVRGQFAVQQERQGQCEHLRLAGAVVAPQQQPAVVEVELLNVVVEQVHQSGAQRLPPLPVRYRHPGAHVRVAFLVPGPVRIVGASTA